MNNIDGMGFDPNFKAPESVEKDPDGLTAEQREMANAQLSRPEFQPKAPTPESELRDCEAEVKQFEGLLENFEASHNLEALTAIIELRPEDAHKYPERQNAKQDLIPIVKLMSLLEKETNISPDRFEKLKENYLKFSRAVGIINNGKVRH